MSNLVVQTSVNGSQLRSTTGSPCKVLQSDIDGRVTVITKSCSAHKNIIFMPSGKTELAAKSRIDLDWPIMQPFPSSVPISSYFPPDSHGFRTDYPELAAPCLMTSSIFRSPSSKRSQMFHAGAIDLAGGFPWTWDYTNAVNGLNNYISKTVTPATQRTELMITAKSWYDGYDVWTLFPTAADLPPQNDPTTNPLAYNGFSLIGQPMLDCLADFLGRH